jgi:hypothetical protein
MAQHFAERTRREARRRPLAAITHKNLLAAVHGTSPMLENKQQGQRRFFSPRVSTASRMGLRKNSKPLTGITACCSLRNKTASRQRAEPCCTFRRAPCAHRKEAREGVVLGRRQGCCSWERGSAQGCCFWIKELGIGKNRPWQE